MAELDLLTDPFAERDPDHEHWTDLAATVAAKLRVDVLDRERDNALPRAEIDLLRGHGLLELTLPRAVGGHGMPWRVGLEVSRVIARVDPGIAHILAYHYGWLRVVEHAGTLEASDLLHASATQHWLWASPGMNRAGLPVLTTTDDGSRLTGPSVFATGAPVADRLLARAVHTETGHLHLVAVDPSADGVTVAGEWDTIGQRLTASQAVVFDAVGVGEGDLVVEYGPLTEPPAPSWSLAVLNFQLIFAALHLGITEGALLEAVDYTRKHTRPWYHSLVTLGVEEPFILHDYGLAVARTQAVAALVHRAERALAHAYDRSAAVTAVQRGQVAELIAAAKVVSTEVGLEVTSRLYDMTGARSTTTETGLDRFWRNLRVLSLHDPVAYKQHELGDFFVNGRLPEPSGYR